MGLTISEEQGAPRCVFEVAWVGRCRAAATQGSAMCEKHAAEKCWCGAQATRQCSVAGSLVCGAPLCAKHECRYTGSGMTGTLPHSENGARQFAEWKEHKAEIDALRERVKTLEGALRNEVVEESCPCCGEREKCMDDCTFDEDHPDDAAALMVRRQHNAEILRALAPLKEADRG